MLRYRSITAVLLVVVIFGAAGQAMFAQKEVRLSSTPAAFQTFYKKFARAVNKGQIETLASMTNFPFKYGFDAGDEGVWTRKEFVSKAGGFLMPQPLIFNERNPKFYASNGVYTLNNEDDASHYTFRKKGGVYRWVSFIVEP